MKKILYHIHKKGFKDELWKVGNEIEIYDEPFKSGNSFIPLSSDSYNDILKKARLYWEQNNTEDKEDDEYLYIGKVKIIKKVE